MIIADDGDHEFVLTASGLQSSQIKD